MFDPKSTVLLVIDVQGKLATLMHESEQVIHNIAGTIKTCNILNIPIIWTEQVPAKVGPTVIEVQSELGSAFAIEKASFSCYLNEKFKEKLKELNRKQVLITGIETHVCVYQTVCDLLLNKYEVEVVADAVSSRTKENKDIALEKIKSLGAKLTTVEMIATELLKTAEHPRFKEVLSLIK